jgi:hypothetical protein
MLALCDSIAALSCRCINDAVWHMTLKPITLTTLLELKSRFVSIARGDTASAALAGPRFASETDQGEWISDLNCFLRGL